MTVAENIVRLPQSRHPAPGLQRPQAPASVPFDRWAEARDRGAVALLGGARRLVLTGPAGTGKTVLVDHLARVMRAAERPVAVQLADADPAPPDAGAILFVDEADRLSPAKLNALLRADGTLVLAGLDTPDLRRVGRAARIKLEPLGQEAIREYVARWLAFTGRTPADLESSAVRRLAELSGGVPRLLNTLLSSATWLAEMADAATVGPDHVEEAAELRSVSVTASAEPPARRGTRVGWSALLAGSVIAATVTVVIPRLFPHEMRASIQQGSVMAGRVETWLRAEWGHVTGRLPTQPPPDCSADCS